MFDSGLRFFFLYQSGKERKKERKEMKGKRANPPRKSARKR